MTKRHLLAVALSASLVVTTLGAIASPASAGDTATGTSRIHTSVPPHQPGDPTPAVFKAPSVKPRKFAAAVTPQTTGPVNLSGGTELTGYYPSALTVDQTDGYVFVSTETGLARTDLNGGSAQILSDVDGANLGVGAMALDEANHTLYALVGYPHQIGVIDTTTFTVTHRWSANIDNTGIDSIAAADGHVWFYDPLVNDGTIAAVDSETGTRTSIPVPGATAVYSVSAVPGQADTISVDMDGASGRVHQWFQVSGTELTAGPTPPADCGAVFTSDNTDLLCNGTLRSVPDFASDGTYPTSIGTPAAASSMGIAVAAGSCADVSPILSVYPTGSTTASRSYTKQYQGIRFAAFNPDGTKLYAVSSTVCSTQAHPVLYVINEPAKAVSSVSVNVAKKVKALTKASVTGTLTFGNGESASGRTVHVTRTDKTGDHAVGDVVTDAAGKFSVTDSATPLGLITYTASFDGDNSYTADSATGTLTREVAWDVNGDGYADAVVGAPGEDVGTIKDAGSVTVLYGHASGVNATGSVAFDQDSSPTIPGGNEAGDFFGYTQAAGDFNRDGYQDVAVAGTGEDIGSATSAGGIWVFYGSASGLKMTGVQMITVSNTKLGSGTKASKAWLGEPMATGDFNGDGIDDIATSTGGHDLVIVMYGTTSGIDAKSGDMSYLSPGYSAPTATPSSLFGYALAAGDINGDGVSDLAIGTPFDYTYNGWSIGSVGIVYGNKTYGLGQTTGAQRFEPTTSGVPGTWHTFGTKDQPDSFGWQVVLADFNGDGKDDLAVGAPGTPVTNTSKHEDAGTVTILYSNGSKISTTGADLITQDSSYVPGSPGKGDLFGATMAAGDTNSNGYVDLAIFSPGDTYVAVIRGGASGISLSTAKGWTQNTSGIPGSSETGDYWGNSLRFGYFKGAGQPAAMMVGADGENSGQGSVTFVYGTTSSGLTATGSAAFSQNTSGVPGTSENGDYFGSFFSN